MAKQVLALVSRGFALLSRRVGFVRKQDLLSCPADSVLPSWSRKEAGFALCSAQKARKEANGFWGFERRAWGLGIIRNWGLGCGGQ